MDALSPRHGFNPPRRIKFTLQRLLFVVMTKWIRKILCNPGNHHVAENRKKQRKIEPQCQNVKPLPSQAAAGASRGTKPPPGEGGTRFVSDSPGCSSQLALGDAGFIYAAHAVTKRRSGSKKKTTPHHLHMKPLFREAQKGSASSRIALARKFLPGLLPPQYSNRDVKCLSKWPPAFCGSASFCMWLLSSLPLWLSWCLLDSQSRFSSRPLACSIF